MKNALILFYLLATTAIQAQYSNEYFDKAVLNQLGQGVGHNGIAGTGYSTKSSVNALSLSPANMAFPNDKFDGISFQYGISFLNHFEQSNDYFDQYLDVVIQPKNSKAGTFAFQIRDFLNNDPEQIPEVQFDYPSMSYIETGLYFKNWYNMAMFKIGYGRTLKSLSNFSHSLGGSLHLYQTVISEMGEFTLSNEFSMDLAYNIRKKRLGMGLLVSKIPLGEPLPSSISDIKEIGFQYSVSIDSRFDENYKNRIVNGAGEFRVEYITNIVKQASENSSNGDKGDANGDLNWALGTEIIVKDKYTFRMGYAFFRDWNLLNSITTGFGVVLRDKIEINLSYAINNWPWSSQYGLSFGIN